MSGVCSEIARGASWAPRGPSAHPFRSPLEALWTPQTSPPLELHTLLHFCVVARFFCILYHTLGLVGERCVLGNRSGRFLGPSSPLRASLQISSGSPLDPSNLSTARIAYLTALLRGRSLFLHTLLHFLYSWPPRDRLLGFILIDSDPLKSI